MQVFRESVSVYTLFEIVSPMTKNYVKMSRILAFFKRIFTWTSNDNTAHLKDDDNAGFSLLYNACWKNKLDVVEDLLEDGFSDMRTRINFLLTRRTKIDKADPSLSPLHIAVHEGNVEIVKVLLKFCAENDIEFLNEYRESLGEMAKSRKGRFPHESYFDEIMTLFGIKHETTRTGKYHDNYTMTELENVIQSSSIPQTKELDSVVIPQVVETIIHNINSTAIMEPLANVGNLISSFTVEKINLTDGSSTKNTVHEFVPRPIAITKPETLSRSSVPPPPPPPPPPMIRTKPITVTKPLVRSSVPPPPPIIRIKPGTLPENIAPDFSFPEVAVTTLSKELIKTNSKINYEQFHSILPRLNIGSGLGLEPTDLGIFYEYSISRDVDNSNWKKWLQKEQYSHNKDRIDKEYHDHEDEIKNFRIKLEETIGKIERFTDFPDMKETNIINDGIEKRLRGFPDFISTNFVGDIKYSGNTFENNGYRRKILIQAALYANLFEKPCYIVFPASGELFRVPPQSIENCTFCSS